MSEKKQYKVLKAIGFGGRQEAGTILSMTEADARNIGIGDYLAPMSDETNDTVAGGEAGAAPEGAAAGEATEATETKPEGEVAPEGEATPEGEAAPEGEAPAEAAPEGEAEQG